MPAACLAGLERGRKYFYFAARSQQLGLLPGRAPAIDESVASRKSNAIV
jgi:hypothetical protein